MSVSGPLWLCMEDEFGGGEEMGSPGKGQEVHGGKGQEVQGAGSPWPTWGWEMENQGRFQATQEVKWTWSGSGPSALRPHLPIS